MDTPLIIETFGKWNEMNDTFTDLRVNKITSRRRQNLFGAKLKASMVVTNNETMNHLEDYQYEHENEATILYSFNYILAISTSTR